MKKTIRLTESDLVRLVKRVIKEQGDLNVEFDPTKKGSSEPKKDEPVNIQNKEAFEKIKAELMAMKKPSRVDSVVFNGKPSNSLNYTDSVYVQGKGGVETYSFSVSDDGHVIFNYKTPETKKVAEENGFIPIPGSRNGLYLKWDEGDLTSNIQKIKNLLSNPKIRVSYDGYLK